jgi:hypothetical protein
MSHKEFSGRKQPLVFSVISRNQLDKLRNFSHINDNSNMLSCEQECYDKLFNVHPLVESTQKQNLKSTIQLITHDTTNP